MKNHRPKIVPQKLLEDTTETDTDETKIKRINQNVRKIRITISHYSKEILKQFLLNIICTRKKTLFLMTFVHFFTLKKSKLFLIRIISEFFNNNFYTKYLHYSIAYNYINKFINELILIVLFNNVSFIALIPGITAQYAKKQYIRKKTESSCRCTLKSGKRKEIHLHTE